MRRSTKWNSPFLKLVSMAKRERRWANLPEVICESILTWLNARDVAVASSVSCDWYCTCSSDVVWRTLVLSSWPIHIASALRIQQSPSCLISPCVINNRVVCLPPVRRTLFSGEEGAVDWRSRYRELLRIRRNWKESVYKESFLVGHTARINALASRGDLIVRFAFANATTLVSMNLVWCVVSVHSCSEDETISIWDVPTQTCKQVLRGHSAPVTG